MRMRKKSVQVRGLYDLRIPMAVKHAFWLFVAGNIVLLSASWVHKGVSVDMTSILP